MGGGAYEYTAHIGLSDGLVILTYFLIFAFVVYFFSKKSTRADEYFLASRDSKWPIIGLALFASNMNATALVAFAGAAYIFGISVYNYEWTAIPVIIFFCIFLIPFILRSRVFTMPEYLEQRYDVRVRIYFLCITLILIVGLDAASVLCCCALVAQKIFPDIPFIYITAALAGTAGLITSLGGLRALIRVQAVQAIELLVVATLLSFTALRHVGGLGTILAGTDKAMLSLVRPANDPGVPWPGLLTGALLLSFYYWCSNQFMVQRVLSAKDSDHARYGVLFTGLLKLPVLFLMILPGICAIKMFPRLEKADTVYPTLLVTLFPPGLTGLVIASFFAAGMAAIASAYHSASTVIAMDLGRLLAPQASSRQLTRIGRLATVVIVLLTMVGAPQLMEFASLFQYLQGVQAYVTPSIVALFLVGMFWKGANAAGANVMLVLGTLASVAFFLGNIVFHAFHLHFLYVSPILFGFDCAILILFSLYFRHGENNQIEKLVWTKQFFHEESAHLKIQPPWKNYRILAAGLMVLTSAIVLRFW